MRDHVLFAAGIFDMLLEEIEIEQINHTKASPSGFIFVARSNSARSCANLDPAGRILRRKLNHAVIGKNHMGALADKEIPINLHAGISESRNFFEERNRIENNAVPDDAAAAFAQHPARNQLQDKSLAVYDDGVAGVVSACITGNDGEFLRQHVNDFA